ncbi:MAG TPA: DUF3833 domain-containing protein [Aquabacterium sp.]|nr:DUF3833 domain-containing protein [Aquabacterium sp.]
MNRPFPSRTLSIGLLTVAALSGCAGPRIQDYAQEQPRLDLRQYFNGPITAHGIFTDRQGKVVKRFVVNMQATWSGNQGTLDEHFTYSDGTKQQRIWHLTDMGQGRFIGRASDVVGDAQGEAAGNALHWNYTLALPVDGRVWHVQFDDWMYLVDEHTMLNRAVMSKWGIQLGEVTLSFTKP